MKRWIHTATESCFANEKLSRFEFIVKRYDNDGEELEVVTAPSLEEAEAQLDNDEYVEYWDYYRR